MCVNTEIFDVVLSLIEAFRSFSDWLVKVDLKCFLCQAIKFHCVHKVLPSVPVVFTEFHCITLFI